MLFKDLNVLMFKQSVGKNSRVFFYIHTFIKETLNYNTLNQGCPTFFHNGPNYTFEYIKRAAKLNVYKISSF